MKYDPQIGWCYEYVNGYPVIGSPIAKKYQNNRKTVMINQLFAEHLVNYYDSKGHRAWDIKTQGRFRFIYHNVKGFVSSNRISQDEKGGTIQIQATHAGTVLRATQDNGGGRYVQLLSGELEILGREAKIETLSYHLDSYRVIDGDERRYKAVLGNAGNTGKYTTGAHLHFGVRPHYKRKNGLYTPDLDNGRNGYVNPLPFMADGTIYQKGIIIPRYFQFGKEQHKKDLDFSII